MAIIKVIKGGYDTPYQMKKLIDYIVNSSRHDIRGMVGGSMLSTGTMQYVYYQMMDLKKSMSKMKGWNMRHFCISFSDRELEYIDDTKAYMIAMDVCRMLFGYQTVFAIHHETGRMHIHFGVNTVSYIHGNKIRIYVKELRNDIQNILERYVPPVKLNLAAREYVISSFEDLDFMLAE